MTLFFFTQDVYVLRLYNRLDETKKGEVSDCFSEVFDMINENLSWCYLFQLFWLLGGIQR